MALTWNDAEEIGVQLFRKYPDIRPDEVSVPDLPRWVAELPDVIGQPPSEEQRLRLVHAHWCEEWREANG